MHNYKSDFRIKESVLNVYDINKQIDFYKNIVGLDIIEQSSDFAMLGAGGNILLRLNKIKDNLVFESYGLYHNAFLVPNRQELANLVKYYVDKNIEFGAADHGYSEALYLNDTEGNGVEIYCDKPMNKWDIRDSGIIVGVVERIDYEGLYALGKIIEIPYLPKETYLGHIHFSVQNYKKSSEFYQSLLNIKETYSAMGASWLASGKYHHQIAVNGWSGPGLKKNDKNRLGISYYKIEANTAEYFKKVENNAKSLGLEIQYIDNKTFEVEDLDRIALRICLD